MSLDERVSSLIKQIYSARDEPAAWEKVCHDVLQATGACAGLTTLVDLRQREFSAFRFYGLEDTRIAVALEEYGEIYSQDPSLIWASAHPRARFCDSTEAIPRDDYLSDPYIKWNRSRLGSVHWCVGYTPPTEQLSFSFSIHFPAEQGLGRPDQIRLFRMLFDHMESATRLSRRPFNLESARALMLLDSAGVVLKVSTGAEQMLRRDPAVQVRDGHLQTVCQADQSGLDALLARGMATPDHGSGPCGMRLEHPSTNREWLVIVRPLLSSFGPFGHVRCELLVELHEGLPKIGSLHLVQSLYGLTGRELALLRLIADDHSLASASEQMQISFHTARAHLRSIFAKTGTSRQSELVHLVGGLAT